MAKITLSNKDITAAHKKYCKLVITEDAPSWHRLVECADGTLEYRLGAGKWKTMTARKFITFVRTVVQAAKSHQIEHLAIQAPVAMLPAILKEHDSQWILSTLAENLTIGSYEFTKYKSTRSKKKQLVEVLVCGGLTVPEKKAFTRGLIVGEKVNLARDIANTTAEDMTPTDLGKAAVKAVSGTKASVKVLGEKELQKLKMGLLLAVGAGTKHETKLIIMEYYGAGKPTKSDTSKTKQPIVFIGKGITYDSGGLNVKPSGHMHDMHMDMSGGSAVIAAVAAAAKLGIKKNIIGLIPAAENAISDRAMRAGDIVTAMNGKTVEVLHTDAEGRMVLADALTYSERYNPKVVLDVATLTGAALSALGQHASAIMTKNVQLETELRLFGEASGDYVWPLPLWDEYQAHIKSTRADLSNIAANFSRFGGAIEGGAFLANFAPKNVPWAHIDIAPRMEAIASDKLVKGSTGEPVRLLVRFAEEY
ncbi:MAG: leucyl aminopeptidase [Patiriisocius sp.]|jgi:leucyl aminopeptidase